MTKECRNPKPECPRAGSAIRHRGFGFRSSWGICSFAIFCSGFAANTSAAEPPKLIGESAGTARRFAEAAELENQQRWADAVAAYLRLLDDAGDDLVPTGGDPRHLLPACGLIHRRIAARPELLAPYRAVVEPRAKAQFERAAAARDRQLLEQVVDRFFCSRSAEAALHLLGDLACERGEFEAARRYWHFLEARESVDDLAFPDPLGGPALPRAKSILARLLAGERAAAAAELQAFRHAHADAVGHLAGRDGNLAESLQSLVNAADTVRVPAPVAVAAAATTFGGDASRNGLLYGVLPPFSPQPRCPPIQLPRTEENHGTQPPIGPSALAYYPVIARGQVFVAVARRVLAYDLATGRLSGRFELPERDDDQAFWGEAKPGSRREGPFTLTVDGDRIYVAMSRPRPRPRGGAAGRSERGQSVIVCLEWRPDLTTPDERLKPRWKLPPPSPAAAWEGTPAVRDGRLFAVATRVEGGRAVTSIACFAADAPAGPVWQRDVYETASETADRPRGLLLTLAGSTVALCSHAGVIVALDAATGRRAWAFRYPSQSGLTAAGPSPCVVAAGRLYAAPADSDRVYCLDAATGSPLWTSDPVPVAHLLGIAQGRVVCTLGGFHAGLCALDAATGRRLTDWGYRIAGAEAFAPFGRGLLCRDRVYWPTRAAGVQQLRWDGTTGYVPTAFRDLPPGNLAYGDGCLAVATADRLYVLVGEPGDVSGPGHHIGEMPPEQRHDLLLWQADMLGRVGRPAGEVRAVFDEAASPEFSPARRFLALVRRAEFEEEIGNAAAAEPILVAGQLGRVRLCDADGLMRFGSLPRFPAPAGNEMAPGSASTPEREARRSLAVLRSRAEPGNEKSNRHPARLRLPLQETWRLPLERGREWALPPEGETNTDCVYVASRGWLARREVNNGRESWRQELVFAPTWLAVANGSLIVAGDNGAARLDAADGRPAWQFEVPAAAPWFDRPGWKDPAAVAPIERLSEFHWSGGRLIARLGSRSVLALDGAIGALVWQRMAPFNGGFYAAYFADGRCVVLQSADGRRWAFDAVTGRTLHIGPAPTEAWPSPPLALDERKLLLAEDGRLVALDRSTWEPVWTWGLPRSLSLTGEPPRTRLLKGVLLVGVPRNDCYEIEQLDPATGRSCFAGEPIAVGRERVDLDSVALDDAMLHAVADGELKTIDRRDGRIIGRRRIEPLANWRVETAANGLLLWTVPTTSPTTAPQAGRVVCMASSEPERQGGTIPSPALGPGPIQFVRIVESGVIVVTDTEIRGYRGANSEVQ